MKWRDKLWVFLAATAIGVTLAVMMAGCASFSDTSWTTLKFATKTEMIGASAFIAYDEPHMLEIVAKAKSANEGIAALEAYRAKQTIVKSAIKVAAEADTEAEKVLKAYDSGQADRTSAARVIGVLLESVGKLTASLKSAGVPLPGGL